MAGWEDFLYGDDAKLAQWFLAILLVVAIMAVVNFIYMITDFFRKDKLIAFKALDQEGLMGRRSNIGRQTVIGGNELLFAGKAGSENFADPYSNRARFHQELGGGTFYEQPTVFNVNNKSFTNVGKATAGVPALNSCSQVLTPADMERIQMEDAFDNKHNKNYYVDPVTANPSESFSGAVPNMQGQMAYDALFLRNQGKM